MHEVFHISKLIYAKLARGRVEEHLNLRAGESSGQDMVPPCLTRLPTSTIIGTITICPTSVHRLHLSFVSGEFMDLPELVPDGGGPLGEWVCCVFEGSFSVDCGKSYSRIEVRMLPVHIFY